MNNQQNDEFTKFLRSKVAEAKQAFGFRGTTFLSMLGNHGGYITVQKLLTRKDPSDGLTDLYLNQRLDLSVEAIVVETKWRSFFDTALVEKAEKILKQYKYKFTPFISQSTSEAPKQSENTVSDRIVSEPSLVKNTPHAESQLIGPRYWWVNQNQTYKSEVPGGFLWSPKAKADGARNQFYENMKEVQVGDIIFSFCDTRIKAIGVAIGKAETSAKPNFGNAGNNWSLEGWLVPVEFKEISAQIRPKDHINSIREHLPVKYSPLQESGDGLQSVYLAAVPAPMAHVLAELIGQEYTETLKMLRGEITNIEIVADQHEDILKSRTDIGPTFKEQLVKSRRGQGVFKANVRLIENGCRITGVTDPVHLRASHIKPWKDSTDEEKIDGCNGLLLAPHIDHLFDRGFISFSSDGDLLISKHLDRLILKRWGISEELNVGFFNSQQINFLKYHHKVVFEKNFNKPL
ncbi:HNH endonuclease [Undibacterium sp. SXout7W]|uniref:HNH endonuclease n=1 Tax=Undibacterium sp. SXout7W TaxID=3413049 RepID=UPI003BF16B9F